VTGFEELRALEHAAGAWRDATELVTGTVTAAQIRLIAESLRGPVPGQPGASASVPPMWLFAACTRWPDAASLGPDGHPVSGIGYPPITPRQRLFAGGRLEVHRPVMVGDTITRRSRVMSVQAVQARTGPLLFVTVSHEFTDAATGSLRCIEQHDLAYRPGNAVPPPTRATGATQAPRDIPAADVPPGAISLRTDEVMLFRFSALTANSHRIHYDRTYAVEVEKLPGLLVHGPLVALLMLETARRLAPERAVAMFSYRLSQPVVCGAQISARVIGERDDSWDVEVAGALGVAASGTIGFAAHPAG
jgi:hydroxyacyl-ACP dehydratase HTD2-like protein with hotdog domain